MDEAPIAAAPAKRLRPALVLAVGLMLLWLVAYWYLSPLSWDLVQLSRQGPRALALYVTGHYRDAARAYRAGQQSMLPVPYMNDPAGYWALRAGHIGEAERRAQATLALVPTAVEPRITLGEIALDRGQTADAVTAFDAVLRRWPDHVDALYLHSVAVARAGDPARAIQDLNRGLRSNSVGGRDTILYRLMELAGELRERAPGSQPLCLLAHLHRYLRVFDDGQGVIAMDYARQAIGAGDRPADAYLTLGIVHDKRGEYESARRAMQQAIAADPKHAESLRWLSRGAGLLGDRLVEYQMITRAFEAAPTDPFYLRDVERIVLTQLGDPRGMVTLMQRAVDLDGGNAEAHARLGKALGLLGDQARARHHGQRAAELHSRQGEAR
jgi:tetratricopeptide (TPR) repeat protein